MPSRHRPTSVAILLLGSPDNINTTPMTLCLSFDSSVLISLRSAAAVTELFRPDVTDSLMLFYGNHFSTVETAIWILHILAERLFALFLATGYSSGIRRSAELLQSSFIHAFYSITTPRHRLRQPCYTCNMQLHRVVSFRPTLCEVASLGWYIICTFIEGRFASIFQGPR